MQSHQAYSPEKTTFLQQQYDFSRESGEGGQSAEKAGNDK
jgi:hypothetical protein